MKQIVLIVEDEIEIAELLQDALRALGIDAQHSVEYPEAMRRLQNQKFDCIILDMRILKGDGKDIVLKTRTPKINQNNQTPIVVTSGHLDKELVTSLKGQIQAAFVKPYNYDEVAKKVLSLIGK